MGGVFAAYLVTLGIVSYRWATGPGQAPPPITLAAAGGLFAGAALAARADERLGNALGWSLVIAATFAPRSSLAPVRQVFGPSQTIAGTGGPARHSLGDPNTPKPVRKGTYYRIDPKDKNHRYYLVNGAGKPYPGSPHFNSPPPGIPLYPSAGANTTTV